MMSRCQINWVFTDKSAHYRRDDPDLRQLPFNGFACVRRVIVGNSDSTQVGEESDEDDEVGPDGLVQHEDRDGLRVHRVS